MKELLQAVSTGMPAKDSLELVKKVGVAKIKSSGKGLFQLLGALYRVEMAQQRDS